VTKDTANKINNFLKFTSDLILDFSERDFSLVANSKCASAALYSLKVGGKRLRPALVLASAIAFSNEDINADWHKKNFRLKTQSGEEIEAKDIIAVASAFEYIHTYSLIHDDLPVMDNDSLRRGRLSCHIKFGVPIAVTAGIYLILKAFSALNKTELKRRRAAIEILRRASGIDGMVMGQALDILGEKRGVSSDELVMIHEHKTAALIQGAILAGAVVMDASSDEVKLLEKVGQSAGLAFQIVDDILDVESTSLLMGKPVGADSAKGKSTYPAIIGLEESKKKACGLIEESFNGLNKLGKENTILFSLISYVLKREN